MFDLAPICNFFGDNNFIAYYNNRGAIIHKQ